MSTSSWTTQPQSVTPLVAPLISRAGRTWRIFERCGNQGQSGGTLTLNTTTSMLSSRLRFQTKMTRPLKTCSKSEGCAVMEASSVQKWQCLASHRALSMSSIQVSAPKKEKPSKAETIRLTWWIAPLASTMESCRTRRPREQLLWAVFATKLSTIWTWQLRVSCRSNRSAETKTHQQSAIDPPSSQKPPPNIDKHNNCSRSTYS